MQIAGNSDTTSTDAVDRAIAVLAVVALGLALALRDWVQAAAVAMLLVVAVTKLRDPQARWLTWMPRFDRR